MGDGIRQPSVAALDRGSVIRQHNLIDQHLQVALGESLVLELAANRLAKRFDIARQNAIHRHCQIPPDSGQLDQQRFPLGFQFLRTLLQHFIERQAVFDGSQQIALCLFRFGKLLVQQIDPLLLGVLASPAPFAKIRHQQIQALRHADLVGELIDNQVVERVHWIIAAWAGMVALALPVGAFVIAIAPAFASHCGHAVATGAFEQSGQQVRRSDSARRITSWRTLFPQCGNLLKNLLADNGFRLDHDPLGRRTFLPGSRVNHVEIVFAEIGSAAQYLVHLLDTPRITPHQLAALCQVLDDFLDAHRPALMPVQIEVVDIAHDHRFGRFDFKALFLAPPTAGNVGHDRFVAEGRAGAVEESLSGVLAHGTRGVLGVFFALVFVKQAEQTARHFSSAVVTGLLRNRGDADAVFLQALFIDAEFDHVAEEAREAVHDDHFEGRRLAHGVGNHLLEDRAFVVGGRSARFDVFADKGVAVEFAPCA